MSTNLEVIDAFVDGERVDPMALKVALSDASGRDYFVDVWALRDAMQQDRDVSAESRVPASASGSRSRRWLVAAALVACVVGGFAAGTRFGAPELGAPASMATGPATPIAAPAARGVFPAPQPTRVIQLEFHPDSARSGGN